MLLVSSCFLLFHWTVKKWTDFLVSVMKDVFVILQQQLFNQTQRHCALTFCLKFEKWNEASTPG